MKPIFDKKSTKVDLPTKFGISKRTSVGFSYAGEDKLEFYLSKTAKKAKYLICNFAFF